MSSTTTELNQQTPTPMHNESQIKQKSDFPSTFSKLKYAPAFYPISLKLRKQELTQKEFEDEYSGLIPASTYKPSQDKNCPLNTPQKDATLISKIEEEQFPNFYCFNEARRERMGSDTSDFKAKFKTEICHYWEMYGTCRYGTNCAFAHGQVELKQRHMSSNYKTKPCKQFFENGYCSYGTRCQFSHKRDRPSFICYLNLSHFSDLIDTPFIKNKFLKRRRLKTFENLAQSTVVEEMENRLLFYEDIIQAKRNMKNSEEAKTNDEDRKIKRGRFNSVNI